MKALLAVPAMLVAINAAADCPVERPTNAPEMPVAAVASKAQMYAAQAETQAYVDRVEAFLNCRQAYLNDMEHNFFVVAAEQAAHDYNQTLRAYRQQQEAVASS